MKQQENVTHDSHTRTPKKERKKEKIKKEQKQNNRLQRC